MSLEFRFRFVIFVVQLFLLYFICVFIHSLAYLCLYICICCFTGLTLPYALYPFSSTLYACVGVCVLYHVYVYVHSYVCVHICDIKNCLYGHYLFSYWLRAVVAATAAALNSAIGSELKSQPKMSTLAHKHMYVHIYIDIQIWVAMQNISNGCSINICFMTSRAHKRVGLFSEMLYFWKVTKMLFCFAFFVQSVNMFNRMERKKVV